MNTYSVSVGISGYITITTEASSREDAIENFLNQDYEEGEPGDIDVDYAMIERGWIESHTYPLIDENEKEEKNGAV